MPGTKIIRLAPVVVVVGVVGFAAAASAQTWRPITRQCSHEIDQRAGCGSCGGLWPAWAECTIKRAFPQTNPARVQQCIAQVGAIRDRENACNACGDPVADVVRCATGK